MVSDLCVNTESNSWMIDQWKCDRAPFVKTIVGGQRFDRGRLSTRPHTESDVRLSVYLLICRWLLAPLHVSTVRGSQMDQGIRSRQAWLYCGVGVYRHQLLSNKSNGSIFVEWHLNLLHFKYERSKSWLQFWSNVLSYQFFNTNNLYPVKKYHLLIIFTTIYETWKNGLCFRIFFQS